MTSTLSWLAYDEDEAEQLRRVVESFGDKGILDPLGFGPIRDGVADLLFPGISTIQTRARYFVLVPRIFQALEAQRVGPAHFPARRKAAEVALIDALLAGSREAGATANDPEWLGIIGRNVRSKVRTTPATIYWNGMWTFGIRRFRGATSEHARQLSRYYRAGGPTLDEDGQPIDDGQSLWDTGVPRAGELPDEIESFAMSPDEADYLTERIQQRCSGSLLATMVQQPEAIVGADAPWDVPASGALGQLLEDAQTFAVLLHGLQLLYNRLLLDRAVAELGLPYDGEQREELDELLADWIADVAELDADDSVASARFERLIDRLLARGVKVPKEGLDLFRVWLPSAATDPLAAFTDARHAAAVRDQERNLKKGLAKLTSRPALEAWATRGELQAASRLGFRWANAHRIVSDIAAPGAGQVV